MTTVIIDSGGANLASLQFALERLDARTIVSDNPRDIINAPRVILPGVGSALDAMKRLRTSGVAEVFPKLTQPVLGICLGMQLLFAHSEEGPTDCLGVVPDTVRRLKAEPGRPVPHMGWNQLTALQADPLLEDIANNDYVYFVHSYAAPVSDITLATTDYGSHVSAVVRCDNFWGTQFHPERSGATGSRILANFLRLN
ncbi:MAG TPA: imidazole glycerol phosphate synthase subunit HisH, partial [Steroidobacteraceae bacterium]|nr:imidazole glycerol phosphate synthase subunit HisH [Steroidobacteraceae bacterium]